MFIINTTIINNLANKIKGLITTHNADTNAHSDKETKSNKVTGWSNPTTNVHYPSEKLVKDSLDNQKYLTTKKTLTKTVDLNNPYRTSSQIKYYDSLFGDWEVEINISSSFDDNDGVAVGDVVFYYNSNWSEYIIPITSSGGDDIFDGYQIGETSETTNSSNDGWDGSDYNPQEAVWVDPESGYGGNEEVGYDVLNSDTYIPNGACKIVMKYHNERTSIECYDTSQTLIGKMYLEGIFFPDIETINTPSVSSINLKSTIDEYNNIKELEITDLSQSTSFNNGDIVIWDLEFEEGGEIELYNTGYYYESNGAIYKEYSNTPFQIATGSHCQIIKLINYYGDIIIDGGTYWVGGYGEYYDYVASSNGVTASLKIERPSIPQYTSQLINNTHILTESHIRDNLTSTSTNRVLSAKQGKELKTLIDGKQATLVSGTNIKTVNNNSLVGSGNVSIDVPSKTSDLTNDSGFLTSHQSLNGYLQTTDVKDNLTSTDTDKPLSANQGKQLKSLVDNKLPYSNGTYLMKMPYDLTGNATNFSATNIGVTGSSDFPIFALIKNTIADNNANATLKFRADGSDVAIIDYTKSSPSPISANVWKKDSWGLFFCYGSTVHLKAIFYDADSLASYENPTIADNLTTNDATQVLSAKQGKILADMIGAAIQYIQQ